MNAPAAPPAPVVPLHEHREAVQARRMMAPSRARRPISQTAMARRRFALRWIKRLLPVGALALLAALVLWPEFERVESGGRLIIRQMAGSPTEAVVVREPRYQGVDEQNRPFNLTAATARQQGVSGTIVDLERPRADMFLQGGNWVLLESRQGRLDRAQNHLDLAGAVTLWHDNGTLLVTEEAAMALRDGHASGNRPVAAQGPFGTLTSEGFRLHDRGQVVIFTGRSRLVLEGGS